MDWLFLGLGVAEPLLVHCFFFGAFYIINFFFGYAPIHNTKKLPMNVTLMLKSVAKLFHIILYTYSVKTNLNFCGSFYFDYHLRELKGFHSLLLF